MKNVIELKEQRGMKRHPKAISIVHEKVKGGRGTGKRRRERDEGGRIMETNREMYGSECAFPYFELDV